MGHLGTLGIGRDAFGFYMGVRRHENRKSFSNPPALLGFIKRKENMHPRVRNPRCHDQGPKLHPTQKNRG